MPELKEIYFPFSDICSVESMERIMFPNLKILFLSTKKGYKDYNMIVKIRPFRKTHLQELCDVRIRKR